MAVNVLLRLSSRGEALVAELLRLSDHIPPLFSLLEKQEQKAYGEVLLDFAFLKTPALFEHKIESSVELIARDTEVWEVHGGLICRVYDLFDSIYKFLRDFVKCVTDIRDGVYIQQTIEGVLLDEDGKQLMCEVLYLYGVLLLLLDAKIDGAVRERIVVAYYRHKGQSAVGSIEDMELLVRRTGYSTSTLDRNGMLRRPTGYPEDYLGRLPRKLGLPHQLVLMMIDRLRSEDMYAQIPSYPMPQHRSTALATQARMLYVLLYFAPEVLDEQHHTMREIVDRHFAGADAYWMVPFYMGFLEELPHVWEPYKAARAALANTVTSAEIKRLYSAHTTQLTAIRRQLAHYLTEGVLSEELALDHSTELLHTARAANVTLRWMMIHRRARLRKLPTPDSDYEKREAEALLLLLMDTAQFEYQLRAIYGSLLEKKEELWEEARKQVVERLEELSDAFTGQKALARIGRDDQLHQWFAQLAEQVRALDSSESNATGRKMHHLIAALAEVEQFHQIDVALQLKQFLHETREQLTRMLRVVNVRESVLVTLNVVSDMAYAWVLMADYTPLMRKRIQHNPYSVLKLRSTFLKLVSILDAPLVRINQSNSPDLPSVSQYYSSEVASFMRAVLQVIPENMFAVLNEIVAIQANELSELPVKVLRSELREWSQLEPRHRLARATHRVSVLTEGVLTMQTTLLGVVKVDPKELLEEGIRSELVKQLSIALQSGLTFKAGGKPADLEAAVSRLATQLAGFRLALEYIADYVKINGLRLWQEEFAGVLNFFVEQERNAFLKRKVHSWQSTFTRAAAAANLAPPAAFQHSFFGRLVRELVHITCPRRAIYSEAVGGWVDAAGKEVVGGRMLSLLQNALGRCGLRGIGSTIGFMVTSQLHHFVRAYMLHVSGDLLHMLDSLSNALTPLTTLPDKPQKAFDKVANLGSKIFTEVHETVWRCGAAQLLRAHVAATLGGSTRIDCSLLHSVLAAADSALLAHLREEAASETRAEAARSRQSSVGAPSAAPTEKGSSALLLDPLPQTTSGAAAADLSPYLEAAGMVAPREQVLLVAPPLPRLPLLLAIFTHSQLGRLAWSPTLATLTEPKGKLTDESIDGVVLVCGVACVLRQFHAAASEQYVGHLTQLLRALLHSAFSGSAASKPLAEPPADACTLILYLELFSRHTAIDVPGLHLYQAAVGSMN